MDSPSYRPATLEEVIQLRERLDSKGRKLVFTNGCFDILHTGHVRYLAEAAALGDALVVALNSDASVRALKGPSRPVNGECDRAEVLAALRCVAMVTVFSEPRVTSLIDAIRPHVYAKGGDYTVDSLNPEERSALDRVGAEIRILPLVPGKSTTATIGRMTLPEAPAGEGEPPLRLAVLGSGHGSNFQAILDAIEASALNAEVAVAISDVADSGFLRIAGDAGVEAHSVAPGPHPWRMNQSAIKELLSHLERARTDVVVLTGFMRFIDPAILAAYPDRVVNVHPSLLPKFKGRNAPQQAIDEGELETGCTVHLVTEQIDAGRTLAQAKVPVEIGDTAESLHARIKREEHRILPQVLHEWRQRGLPVRVGT